MWSCGAIPFAFVLDSCLLYFSPFYALFQWTTTLLLHSAQRHAHYSVLCTALISYNSLKSLLLLESSTVLSQHSHSQSTQPLHRVSTLSLSLFFFPFPKLHDVSFCLCRWRRWFYRGFPSILLLNVCFLWLIYICMLYSLWLFLVLSASLWFISGFNGNRKCMSFFFSCSYYFLLSICHFFLMNLIVLLEIGNRESMWIGKFARWKTESI